MSSQDFKDWESSGQIDPLMLRLLQKKYEAVRRGESEPAIKQRKLGALYAAFIGVGAMVMVMLLGVIRGTDVDQILLNSCRSLLVFCIIGFIAGKIAEMCVHQSAKSMIYEMLRRSENSASPASGDSKIE